MRLITERVTPLTVFVIRKIARCVQSATWVLAADLIDHSHALMQNTRILPRNFWRISKASRAASNPHIYAKLCRLASRTVAVVFSVIIVVVCVTSFVNSITLRSFLLW